ncbi:LacI family transcriptional regulator [Echinicola pacifica]|uniref:LacI family transcriptional regulator n=1 Tax=Echinicola pacifica TaxID=346377 RepID=A0A918Q2D0_9BACT|nr:LacI family DNA-binding transcriptional regulator [Echinicola pacifica]GGZ30588.1 LacI family transcriptional regulator [Echinicola pacifica]
MQKKRHSIKAIAKELNISVTTVSFVLNGKAEENRISQKLIDKVQAYVKEIGYQPSQLAKSLRTGKSNIIVFMVEDISNPFFATIAKMIEDKAYEEGYKIIYVSTNDDAEKTKGLIRMFKDLQVDGYILTPPLGLESEFVEEMSGDRNPLVLFDRYLPEVNCSHVVIDNFQGSKQGLDLFQAQGNKNIGFITIDSDQSQMHDRLEAYHQMCQQNDMEPKVLAIPYKSYSSQETEQAMKAFIEDSPEMDAVFFATNYLAMRGMQLIKQLGIKVPANMAVIAFDDNEFFKFSTPSVTSIVQPKEEIANQLIQTMLSLINTPVEKREPLKIVLHAELKERESTQIKVKG